MSGFAHTGKPRAMMHFIESNAHISMSGFAHTGKPRAMMHFIESNAHISMSGFAHSGKPRAMMHFIVGEEEEQTLNPVGLRGMTGLLSPETAFFLFSAQ
jgi:acyl CoA:acetate/3-ketoacid CoA transferase alpha subunit